MGFNTTTSPKNYWTQCWCAWRCLVSFRPLLFVLSCILLTLFSRSCFSTVFRRESGHLESQINAFLHGILLIVFFIWVVAVSKLIYYTLFVSLSLTSFSCTLYYIFKNLPQSSTLYHTPSRSSTHILFISSTPALQLILCIVSCMSSSGAKSAELDVL